MGRDAIPALSKDRECILRASCVTFSLGFVRMFVVNARLMFGTLNFRQIRQPSDISVGVEFAGIVPCLCRSKWPAVVVCATEQPQRREERRSYFIYMKPNNVVVTVPIVRGFLCLDVWIAPSILCIAAAASAAIIECDCVVMQRRTEQQLNSTTSRGTVT